MLCYATLCYAMLRYARLREALALVVVGWLAITWWGAANVCEEPGHCRGWVLRYATLCYAMAARPRIADAMLCAAGARGHLHWALRAVHRDAPQAHPVPRALPGGRVRPGRVLLALARPQGAWHSIA